jgi:hypothetical protein
MGVADASGLLAFYAPHLRDQRTRQVIVPVQEVVEMTCEIADRNR